MRVEIRDAALEAQGARLIRFEDAAQLAFRRGGFFIVVKRVAQYEVVHDGAATVVPAAPPETLFPKALLYSSTVAHLLTSKFALGPRATGSSATSPIRACASIEVCRRSRPPRPTCRCLPERRQCPEQPRRSSQSA